MPGSPKNKKRFWGRFRGSFQEAHMEDAKCINTIYLLGDMLSPLKYSHTVYGEGFYNFEMGVRRLSGKADILPVTVSERLLDFTPVCEGETFAVTGQIRSYNKRN